MAQSIIIHGVSYPDVPEVQIPKQGSGTAHFYDTSAATAANGDVLSGKTYFKDGGSSTGSMANNGVTGGEISTKDGTVSIPAGYTSGGSVGLSSTFKSSIVSGNIKAGASIGGVNGKTSVVDTEISSGGAGAGQILSGYKAYVNGSLISGTASMPSISQDSSTKVLSIS